jgi:hypothetical protein
MVDEDLPHDACSDAEEVGAVLPAHVLIANQPHIRFVDQGGRLKRVIAPLAPHVGASSTTQFSLHGLEESLAIVGRACSPSPQERRQIVSGWLAGHGLAE